MRNKHYLLVFPTLFLLFLVQNAGAHSFGRFGFYGFWRLPGMVVSKTGIVSEDPGSNSLNFDVPAKSWRAKVTNPYMQTVALQGSGQCPVKLSANLLSPNVAIDFADGFSFVITGKRAPFLTWKAGSVAANVPTPELAWVLISFSKSQPPILLSLPDSVTQSFKIVGKPGEWRIITSIPYAGWMKVGYPFGDQSFSTTTAAEMGEMVNQFLPNAPFWNASAPRLLGVKIEADHLGVTGEWVFSSPALLPPAVVLARDGGYNLQSLTGYKLLGVQTNEGPMVESIGNELKVRFPDRWIPPGRYLSTHLPKDIPSPNAVQSHAPLSSDFVDLGLQLLSSGRTMGAVGNADDDYQNLLISARFTKEVWTGDSVTYDASGFGINKTSAIAFLNECQSAGQNPNNPMLTSVVWSRDWYSWLPLENQASIINQRRSAAICAVAGALSQDPATRLDACLFEAGLSAQAALKLQALKVSNAVPKGIIEPLESYRAGIFGQQFLGQNLEDVSPLFSPIKIISHQRVWATIAPGGFQLHWLETRTGMDQLSCVLPLGDQLGTLTGAETIQQSSVNMISILQLKADKPGICTLDLTNSSQVSLPKTNQLPIYTEINLKTSSQSLARD